MCRVQLRENVTLEVFPSIACDDVSQVVVEDFSAGQEIEIQAVQADDYCTTFVLPDHRSSTIPLQFLTVLRPCGCCELVGN